MLMLFIGSDRINLDKVEAVRLNAIGPRKVEIITGTESFRYEANSPEGQAVAFFFDSAQEYYLTLKALQAKGGQAIDLLDAKRAFDAMVAQEAEAAAQAVRTGSFPHPDQGEGRAVA